MTSQRQEIDWNTQFWSLFLEFFAVMKFLEKSTNVCELHQIKLFHWTYLTKITETLAYSRCKEGSLAYARLYISFQFCPFECLFDLVWYIFKVFCILRSFWTDKPVYRIGIGTNCYTMGRSSKRLNPFEFYTNNRINCCRYLAWCVCNGWQSSLEPQVENRIMCEIR